MDVSHIFHNVLHLFQTTLGNISASKLKQPLSKELRHEWTKRRRPTIQQLTSSQLTEEYAKLAKIKQEVFENEKENAKEKMKRDEIIFKLRKRKLELEIKQKIIEIKKIKRAT